MDGNTTSKRLSLLVDYSTHKANLSNIKDKSTLFPDQCSSRGSCRLTKSVAETIDDVLAETKNLRCSALSPEDLDGSFSLDDNDESSLGSSVSFRVRRSGMERCKSFDERIVSSYDHLQNSLSAMISAELDDDHDDDHDEHHHENFSSTNVASSSGPSTSSSPPTNRRLYLARSCSVGGSKGLMPTKSQSMHNTARPSPAHILRKTKSSRNVFASTPPAANSSIPTDPAAVANCCPGRRGQLQRCGSCRKGMRRVKSLNEASTLKLLEESMSSVTKSLQSNTGSSTAHFGSRRTYLLKTLSSKTLSHRNLITSSSNHHPTMNRTVIKELLNNSSSQFSSMDNSLSSHHPGFPKKSCIRRLDKNNSSNHGSMAANSLRQSLFMMSMSNFDHDDQDHGFGACMSHNVRQPRE